MNKLALENLLRRRHPEVELVFVNLCETGGPIYQVERYRGTRKGMIKSGLATERMFSIQPAHWRTPTTTEFGCRYSLCCLDEVQDIWELAFNIEDTPDDGYGEVSFLTKRGLKEAGALLQRIFAGNANAA